MAMAVAVVAAPAPLPRPSDQLHRRRALFPLKPVACGRDTAQLSGSGVARLRRLQMCPTSDVGCVNSSLSGAESSSYGEDVNEMLDELTIESSNPGISFLAKLAVALGIAVTATLISFYSKQSSSGPSFFLPSIVDSSSQSLALPSDGAFTLSLFGRSFIIPQYAPGWVYFWLLMAAGCGLFISEETLNVWVGISIARALTFDGTWKSLANSFSANSSYIISTVLWVYWGVCISDLIPFYLGKLFRKTNASKDLGSKFGIGNEKVKNIVRTVQKYGNLIGFVERFSIGVRNPTAFFAGACGVSADCFFAGVCGGGLITLPMQMAVGFALRERPAVALATVAAVVGIWTIFPYAIAALTALFLVIRRSLSP